MSIAALAVLLFVSQAEVQTAPPPQRGMAKARLYFGPSGGQQGGQQFGTGAVLGYQGYNEISPSTASFWALEFLFWKVGDGTLPIFTGDFGLRWAPWPYAFLKPFVAANLGLSLLVILPVPSFALALGLAIPLGDAIRLDVTFRARNAINVFNTNASVTIGSLEVGIGF